MFNTNFLCLLCQLSSKQLKMWKNITLLILLLYQIWVPSPKNGWTQAKNNEFVESELENWAKMSSTTNKVGSNDKNRKINWFKLKKIILDTVRRDKFLYISHKFDYKFDSWLLQCFSLDFDPSLSFPPSSFIFSSSFIFFLHVQARWLVLILVPSVPS